MIKNVLVEIDKPPNITGNSKELKSGKNLTLSFEKVIGNKDAIIPLEGEIKVDGQVQLEESSASYRLVNDVWNLQFYRIEKNESGFYNAGGGGFQGFPYVFLGAGVNKAFFDLGGAALFGFAIQAMENNGLYETNDGKMWGYSSISNKLSYYAGAYIHANFYISRFALNYIASITSPTSNNVCGFGDECEKSFTFDFPYLLMQDIGIAYTNNKIKYRIGINQITGAEFAGQYWGTSFQAAWLW